MSDSKENLQLCGDKPSSSTDPNHVQKVSNTKWMGGCPFQNITKMKHDLSE